MIDDDGLMIHISQLSDPVSMIARAGTFTEAQIEILEGWFLRHFGAAAMEVEHRFAPGVYMRTITMPTGSYVIGHKHNTSHANVILSGDALVMMDGEIRKFSAGDVVNSNSGVRKMLFIMQECRWMTIHPTEETDIQRLEETLVTKSKTYLRFTGEGEKLLVNERTPQ